MPFRLCMSGADVLGLSERHAELGNLENPLSC